MAATRLPSLSSLKTLLAWASASQTSSSAVQTTPFNWIAPGMVFVQTMDLVARSIFVTLSYMLVTNTCPEWSSPTP